MSEKKPFNVLVADDEESIRMIIEEVLTDEGYTVMTAANGKEALEKVHEGNIHVVITDIRMPEMTGIELLEKVKNHNAEIEVVIMTSYASIETAVKAIRLGAYDYLTKPFEDLSIIPTVIDRTVHKISLEMEIQKLLKALSKRNEEIESLYNFTTAIANTLDHEAILQTATRALGSLTGAKMVRYFAFQSSDNTLKLHIHYPNKEPVAELTISMSDNSLNLKNFKSALESMGTDPFNADDFNPVKVYPIGAKDEAVGCFVLYNTPDNDTEGIANQYIGNISSQIEKAQLYAQIEELAIRDELTGLANRRHMKNTLEAEIERAKRFEKPISVILFDVDYFKHYNDTNGHVAGDELLRKLGGMLKKSSRSSDFPARYGGEEFLIVLVETDKAGSKTKAERLRELIQDEVFPYQENQPQGNLTVSGGYATYPEDGVTAEALIDAADKALYKSKEAGRNRMTPAE